MLRNIDAIRVRGNKIIASLMVDYSNGRFCSKWNCPLETRYKDMNLLPNEVDNVCKACIGKWLVSPYFHEF